MRQPPVHRRLADGRWHFHDGPIDLVLEAYGEARAVDAAYAAAWRRFATVLDELCDELPLLRAPSTTTSPRPEGVVARRMTAAVASFHAERFITPMAAVAGAVAEEILDAMTSAAPLARAYVNDGGDIALHLEPGETFAIGMVDRPDRPSLFGRAAIRASDRVRGIATSGWRGRSFSLGIADAVTVLASSAAIADAAATLIANAVDISGHPSIRRTPARELDPQSDLADRLVTTDVGQLAADEIDLALAPGALEAERWRHAGVIQAAALRLGNSTRLVGAGAKPTKPWAAIHGFTTRGRPMPSVEVRKQVTIVEDIFHEGGPVARSPYRRAAILSVIRNPFAGRFVEDIVGFSDDLKPLGLQMARALIAALGDNPKKIEGYGKGAIVGAAGEVEHGALWHAPGGYAMREALGGAKAIVPSAKKVAGPGARLDVPITHIDASYVRSHFDAIEVGIADAPRADEMLLVLAMTTGPRVHDRAGGLKASEIKGLDGLR